MPAQTGSTYEQDMDILRAAAVAPLSPDQGMEARQIGKRIRWAGAILYMTPSDKGVCLTLLYALSGERGEPHWTGEPTYQTFEACTTGAYDPTLVHDGSNVTIVGKITGKTYIGLGGGGSPGPVVEIEKLFRWSDCLAGDSSAVCRTGFVTPQAVTND